MEKEQNMGRVIINKNKAVGKVIFVVEGKKDEFKLFTQVFEKILSFTVIKCRSEKTNLKEYVLPDNRDSVIFLINSNSSSLKSINETMYIQKIFTKLNNHFKMDIYNSAIYFVWDRDRESTNPDKVKNLVYPLFKKYYNARDNEFEMQGLLLLSYPALESFIISCFENGQKEEKIENIKTYVTKNEYHFKKINETALICAAETFLNRFEKIMEFKYNQAYVDTKMTEINSTIFQKEEEYYEEHTFYYYFSCILISLFDLGLLELEEGNELKAS